MICTRWRRRNAIPSTWPDRRMASRTQAAPLQRKHGLGAWQVSGMFYGRPTPRLSRRSSACGRISSAAARPAISHEEALGMAPLRVAIDSMDGRPSANELGMLQWRPGSGNSWFLPGTPMVGKQALALDRLGRAIFAKHGWITSSCTSRPRDSRGPACPGLEQGRQERKRAGRCLLSGAGRNIRQARRRRWPRPGGLPRPAHAADDPGTARRLRRHQEGA